MSSLQRALTAYTIVIALAVAFSAGAARAATLLVDRTDDAYNSQASACTAAANDCSLRGAVEKANATAGDDSIIFDATVFAERQTISLSPPNEGTASVTEFPHFSSNIDISGPAAGVTLRTFNGNRLFTTDSGAKVSLIGLTVFATNVPLTNDGNTEVIGCSFSAAYRGVGILSSGTLTVRDSTISSDQDALVSFGTATIERSLIAYTKNAIYNSGVLTLRNSTVAATNAFSGSFGDTTIDSCTILGGTIGNASFNGAKTSNSIIRTGDRFRGDGGNNLFGDEVNAAGLDPAGLKDNGGPTYTIALLPGGTAIDASRTALATDQRGVARPQGNVPDIGAFELQSTTPGETASLVVTTLSDVTASDGQTSLREAINYANFKAGADTVTFADNVRGTLGIGSQLPLLTDDISIRGPGARVLTVDGGGAARLLRIRAGANVSISDITLSGGNPSVSNGDGRGGALLNEGDLTLRQVALTGNSASQGGGLSNFNGSATLIGCLLSGNKASSNGGGFDNFNGRVTVINCTISGNRTSSNGGGFTTSGATGNVSLDSVTITGNSVPFDENGAGAQLSGGELRIHNSILFGNGVRVGDIRQLGGTLNSRGYNIIGGANTSGGTRNNGPSDRGVDPRLGPLQDNGGQTFTHALLAGSPAINSGDPSVPNGFDQRGDSFPRVRGGRADVGAFELQSDARAVSVSLSPRDPFTDTTLTATPDGFSDGSILSYQWKRNGTVIPNETRSTLDLRPVGHGGKGDDVSVEVTSSDGAASDSVTVANSAPFAVTVRGEVDADTEIRLPLRGFDADGTPVSFLIASGPSNGTASIEPGTSGQATLVYRSRKGYNGVEVIRFVAVSDGQASAPSTVGISVKAPPVNRAPIAGDTSIDTYVGDSVVKGLLGSDPDGDAISFRIVNNAKFGRSEIKRDADGFYKLFYTGLNRFYGDDRVTYIVTDSRGKESEVASVNIHFINRAPVAHDAQIGVASGQSVSQYLFADDPDGDAVTFRLVNNPRYGAGEIKRDERGKWRVYYQSLPGYIGTDRITFIAIDAQGKQSQVALINIKLVRALTPPDSSGGAS